MPSSDRPHRWPLLLILTAAVLVRVVYFAQLSSSGGPLLQLHRWDQSDMHFYDQWAKIIAAGDVLTDRSLHPMHDWHVAVAMQYMAEHPEAVPAGPMTQEQQVRVLWDRWYGGTSGGKRFHQEPLYAYLIAATYAVLGEDVRWVFLWQMAMGVTSTWLVYRIGRRCFGEGAGLVAAGMMVFAGPLMVYELVLLRGPLITFLGLLAVDAAGVAVERKKWGWWVGAGAACGAAMLAHGGAQVLVPVVAGVAVISGRLAKPPFDKLRICRQAWISAGLVILGVVIALSPAMVRNLIVGVGPLQLSSVGAVTFVATNGPGQHADLSFYATTAIPEVIEAARAGGPGVPGVVRGTIAMHEGLGSYLGLVGRKIAMAWRWFEKPNNMSFAYYAKHAWVLYLLPVRFAVVMPLAVVGLVVMIVTRRREWLVLMPLLALIGVGVLSSIVAAPHARYRAPLVAWAAPVAGFLVVWVVRGMLGNAKPQAWVVAVVIVVGLFAMTSRPLPAGVSAITVADWLSPYRAVWVPAQEEAAATGDWAGAIRIIESSYRHKPAELDKLDRAHPAATAEQADLARFYAAIDARYAEALRHVDRTQDALAAERRSMDLVEAAATYDVTSHAR